MFELDLKAQINKDSSEFTNPHREQTKAHTYRGFYFSNIASGLNTLRPIDPPVYSQTQVF